MQQELTRAHAIQMTKYGEPDVLKLVQVVLPPVGPREVRFRMLAAAVNRSDVMIRRGTWPIRAANPFPYTPGLEAVGEVTAVGGSVRTVHTGDLVITMMQHLGGIHGERPGGYQEFVTVPASSVAIIPPDLNPRDVAALGLAGVTALNGLRPLMPAPARTLVIHGATGGVGSAAVRIAKALGAIVIATTSSTAKDSFLRQIGVETIVHLAERSLMDQLGAASVDGVFDTVGGPVFGDSVQVRKQGGWLSLVGAAASGDVCFSAWELLRDVRLTGWSSEDLTGEQLRADMAELLPLLAGQRLQPPPYQTFSLADAAKVHTLMEHGGLLGRALLVP